MDKEEQIHAELSAIDANGRCLGKTCGIFLDNADQIGPVVDRFASKHYEAVRVVVDIALPEAYEARRESEKAEHDVRKDLVLIQSMNMVREMGGKAIAVISGLENFKATFSIGGKQCCIDTNCEEEFTRLVAVYYQVWQTLGNAPLFNTSIFFGDN